MKGLRLPLWLICDAAAGFRLALATLMLSFQVRRHWPKHTTKTPTPEGVAQITVWLAFAEALVRWAIMRQALRISGLDPSTARIVVPRPAASSVIWQARCRTFVRLIENMNLYARRWAKRIRAVMANEAVRTPSPDPSNPANFQNPNPTNPYPANSRLSGFPVAIRGPPWRAHDCRLPTADCLAARASEVAGVCRRYSLSANGFLPCLSTSLIGTPGRSNASRSSLSR